MIELGVSSLPQQQPLLSALLLPNFVSGLPEIPDSGHNVGSHASTW